jgi:hypothetical protein
MNSVLFSLNELRQLEDERVRTEAEARRAQAEAERRARVEAEQRARDEETRRVREEEERRQRVEREREARQREDRLRVEEAERRARVEGELALKGRLLLEEQRQRLVTRPRLGRSAWMAVAVAATLFVVVGALAVSTSRQHQVEKAALEREVARRGEQARASQLAVDAQIRALEEKARLLGDLQRQKRPTEVAPPRAPRRTAPPAQPMIASPKRVLRAAPKPEISDEPLGDLPGVQRGGF